MKKLKNNRVQVLWQKYCILICVLKDDQGGHTHAVEMNLKLGLLYDFMEQYELVLNKDNLSRWCGDDKQFQSFMYNAESKLKL